MIIEDGTGNGYKTRVNEENLLGVYAIVVPIEQHVNHTTRRTYSCVIEQTPSGAEYYFCYLKNISIYDLIITSMKIYTPSLESISVYLNPSGTAVGTTYIPVNKYAGSGETADITAVVGNNITGLSGGSLADKIIVLGSSIGMTNVDRISNIIIPKNTSIAFSAVTGSIKINATLEMYFHNI